MKRFLLLCTVSAASYMGWLNYHSTKSPTSETPTAPPKLVSATPAPTPKRRLAPDGTFFLLTYQSVRTAHGITGFPPGTQVTAVSDFGSTLAVRADGQEITVAKGEVTNDLDVANAVLKADSSEQTALFAKGFAQSNAAAQAKARELQREAENLNRRMAMVASQPHYVAQSSNPLDRGAYGQTPGSRLTAEQRRNLPQLTAADRLSELYSAEARATSADVAALQDSRNAPGANHANIDAQIRAKQAVERMQWDQSTRALQNQ